MPSQKTYAEVKEDILQMIIWASIEGGRRDLDMSQETLDRLKTFDGFRAAFEGGKESNEGFYACANVLQDGQYHYREIVFNLQVLGKQIDFVLHNYPIADENVFAFFKRLETLIMRLEFIGPGYDEVKPLSSFLWEIYAGFSWTTGHRGYDIVENMIDDI